MRHFITVCFLLLTITCCAGVFDEVRLLPASQRVEKAQDIYANKVRRADSVFSINAIRELHTIAVQLEDRPLECFSVSLLADQYARIRKENELSTSLHREAIKLAEKYRLPMMVGICNYRMGRYYYNFKNYSMAFEYLLRADNLFRELGYKDIPDMFEILFIIGSIYYETGDFDKAETYLQNIQQLKKIGPYVQKQSLNTIALIRRQLGDTANAMTYFQKTLAAAEQQKDTVWIGICYGNIGSLYFYKKEYNKAYPDLQRAADLSFHYKQWSDAYADLLLLARIDIVHKNIASAQKRIDSAIKIQPYHPATQGRKLLYETQLFLYEATGRQAQAFEKMKELMLVKDSLAITGDQQTYKKVLLRMETERHLADIDKLEAQARSASFQRNAEIIGLLLLLVLLFMGYSRSRLKAKNMEAILQAEKMQAEEKLKNARTLLQNFTENARRKNELLETFAAELERLKSNLKDDPKYAERLANFETLVRSRILTDEEWADFRSLFDKVHKGFFTRLEQKLPGLALNEIRLLSLIKLGLANEEIGKMMGMGTTAVQNARLDLRNKIHPAQDGLQLEDIVQAV